MVSAAGWNYQLQARAFRVISIYSLSVTAHSALTGCRSLSQMSLGRMWGRGVGGSHLRQLAQSEIRETPRFYAERKVQRVHTQRKMFYSIAISLLSVCSVSECYIIKQLNGKLCRLTSSPPGPLHCVANSPFTGFFKLPLNVNVSVNGCSSQGTRFLRAHC